MPSFSVETRPPAEADADLLAVAVAKDGALSPAAAEVDGALDGVLHDYLTRAGAAGSFKGKVGQVATMPGFGKIAAPTLMVVGIGDAGPASTKDLRRAAGAAARAARGYSRVALYLAGEPGDGARAVIEGFSLGCYSFDSYLTEKANLPAEVSVAGASQGDVDRAAAIAASANWARDMVNEPPSICNPEEFARRVAERAATAGLSVEILDEVALEEAGMQGILTVGKGSESPPRFAVVTYDPPGAQGFLGLIGKGITFDSGGLSIKSAEGMEKMKADCAGAAAVIGAITALPALGPKIKVVAAVALAENMPGGRAVKPGDVIRHYGGRTSEVLNTDAEGRLVLADALAWMSERRPDAMVDLATLTGGMVVALGNKVAGVLSTSRELSTQLLNAAGRTDEPLWALPLIEEYRSSLDSTVADIKNISGSRGASPIIGALFLKDFVDETPWAHLDIAGPAWSDKAEHYLPAGATGYGTRLLIDWIEHRAMGGEQHGG